MEINPNRRATATTMSPPTGALLARGRAEPVPDVPLLDLGNEMLVVDEEQWLFFPEHFRPMLARLQPIRQWLAVPRKEHNESAQFRDTYGQITVTPSQISLGHAHRDSCTSVDTAAASLGTSASKNVSTVLSSTSSSIEMATRHANNVAPNVLGNSSPHGNRQSWGDPGRAAAAFPARSSLSLRRPTSGRYASATSSTATLPLHDADSSPPGSNFASPVIVRDALSLYGTIRRARSPTPSATFKASDTVQPVVSSPAPLTPAAKRVSQLPMFNAPLSTPSVSSETAYNISGGYYSKQQDLPQTTRTMPDDSGTAVDSTNRTGAAAVALAASDQHQTPMARSLSFHTSSRRLSRIPMLSPSTTENRNSFVRQRADGTLKWNEATVVQQSLAADSSMAKFFSPAPTSRTEETNG